MLRWLQRFISRNKDLNNYSATDVRDVPQGPENRQKRQIYADEESVNIRNVRLRPRPTVRNKADTVVSRTMRFPTLQSPVAECHLSSQHTVTSSENPALNMAFFTTDGPAPVPHQRTTKQLNGPSLGVTSYAARCTLSQNLEKMSRSPSHAIRISSNLSWPLNAPLDRSETRDFGSKIQQYEKQTTIKPRQERTQERSCHLHSVTGVNGLPPASETQEGKRHLLKATGCREGDRPERKDYDRLNRMNQAAKHFLLQTVENGSWVGMVHFDSTANVNSKLIQITSNNERNVLLKSLPTAAGGGTSICAGIQSAFQVIREMYPQIDGTEIVLLTDGEDSSAKNCVDEVKNSGAIIHFIVLGPSADKAVIQMSILTGGSHFFASDEAQNNGLINAFGALASGNTDISQQSLQLESKGLMLNNDPWMNGTVIIDSTVGKDTFFFVTWNKQSPIISLWDPNGTPMGGFTADTNSEMAYLSIPGAAKVGVWTYSLQAKANPETLTITVNSRAANSAVPPITVKAKMNKDTNSFPSPMIVYAEILQGYLPILGATVTAFIESNSGNTEVLELLDNGAGKIEANPPKPEIEDTQTNSESFTRTASGGAFVISNVSTFPLPDLYPPSQITDLEATPDGDVISLTWTAPGDNFDVGKVKEYIIKISGSILDLRDHFDEAQQINTTDLLPKEANSKETFAFKLGNISEENATHVFIAIQSVDKSNLTSRVSNIAQVALFVPQADDESHPNPSPDDNYPNSGISISSLVLIVVGSVVVVSIILSTTLCILNKKKNSSRPRTGF